MTNFVTGLPNAIALGGPVRAVAMSLDKTYTGPVFHWKKCHACDFCAISDTFDDLNDRLVQCADSAAQCLDVDIRCIPFILDSIKGATDVLFVALYVSILRVYCWI